MHQLEKVYQCKCERSDCGHEWLTRYGKVPALCPRCRSKNWDISGQTDLDDPRWNDDQAEFTALERVVHPPAIAERVARAINRGDLEELAMLPPEAFALKTPDLPDPDPVVDEEYPMGA